MTGWPTSSEVGNTNSVPEFAFPTAKAMGHPIARVRTTDEAAGCRALTREANRMAKILRYVLMGLVAVGVAVLRLRQGEFDGLRLPGAPVS